MDHIKIQGTWIKIVLALIFNTSLCNAQVLNTVAFNGKTYKVYTSVSDAYKVNLDSVEGIVLCSNGFKDFPKEILRFRNLKYLNICSSSWKNFKDSISTTQILINDSLEKKCDRIIDYKPNFIKTIPKAIKKLKKLELVDLSTAYVSEKAIYQLYKYLPKVERLPDYKNEKMILKLNKN